MANNWSSNRRKRRDYQFFDVLKVVFATVFYADGGAFLPHIMVVVAENLQKISQDQKTIMMIVKVFNLLQFYGYLKIILQ